MKLIFIGTADFATPSLGSVAQEHDLELVVTQPDRPSGRGMKSSHSPVKERAIELGIPVFQPEDINSKESLEKIEKIDPRAFVLAAYGQIISRDLLSLVEWPINIHGSLLPNYRGAAPINWAVIRGEKVTGVTTIIMDEGLDSGPILLKKQTEIGKNETAGELHDRLADMAGDLVLRTLAGLEEGTVEPKVQKGEPTYAPKLTKEDGLLNWNQSSTDVHNLIRGTSPWPGAHTFLDDQQVKVHRSRDLGKLRGELLDKLPLQEGGKDREPGEIIDSGQLGLIIKCGRNTAVKLTKVQPPSKSEMSGTDFVNGYHLETGDRFTGRD